MKNYFRQESWLISSEVRDPRFGETEVGSQKEKPEPSRSRIDFALGVVGSPRRLLTGAPTDPDVRNSRIRLLKSSICCATVPLHTDHTVTHPASLVGLTAQAQVVSLRWFVDSAFQPSVPPRAISRRKAAPFSPDMSRLYFSSQRGEASTSATGITYEVQGPFQM